MEQQPLDNSQAIGDSQPSEGQEFLQLIGLGHVAGSEITVNGVPMRVDEFMQLPSCNAMARPLLSKLREMTPDARATSPLVDIMHRRIGAHLLGYGVDIIEPNSQQS